MTVRIPGIQFQNVVEYSGGILPTSPPFHILGLAKHGLNLASAHGPFIPVLIIYIIGIPSSFLFLSIMMRCCSCGG
jgi:hypothetical protein